MGEVDGWVSRTLKEIGEDAFRDGRPVTVPLDETTWALSRMTPEALDRLATFIGDLARRHPLSGPAWQAHRDALGALESDIRRALDREP